MVLLDVGDIPLHVAKICKCAHDTAIYHWTVPFHTQDDIHVCRYLATDSGRSVTGQTKKHNDVVNPKFQLAADIFFAIFAVVSLKLGIFLSSGPSNGSTDGLLPGLHNH